MKKENIIKNFITAWKPLFDEYPEINEIPVYAWGRYYKYELSGSPFESYVEEGGLSGFYYMLYNKTNINWELIEKIDETHNQMGGKIWTGDWGGFSPNRKDMVKHWDFDDRGGMCVVIFRNENELGLKVVECDSPE